MKKKILVFIDWFLPGYKAGGQIPSVANLIKLLKDEADFFVVTSDRDEGDTAPYPSVPTNQWIEKHDARIIYLSPEQQNRKMLQKIITSQPFDHIYFNSFFSYRFTILPLMIAKKRQPAAKILLAPRGMLGSGALAIKAFKKKLFLHIARFKGLYSNIEWHASSSLEANEIRAIFGNNLTIKTAIDISLLPQHNLPPARNKTEGHLRLFFLSRITEKKNLHQALQFLPKVKARHIVFDIIGPVDDKKYWEKCQQTIQELPAFVEVNYKGSVAHTQLPEMLRSYHFFLFPTRNENYGHVIAEALVEGCPVIISDQTPWRQLQSYNAGWDIPLSETNRWIEVLNYCAAMNNDEFSSMSANALKFARKRLLNPQIIADNKRLFL